MYDDTAIGVKLMPTAFRHLWMCEYVCVREEERQKERKKERNNRLYVCAIIDNKIVLNLTSIVEKRSFFPKIEQNMSKLISCNHVEDEIQLSYQCFVFLLWLFQLILIVF